MSASRSAAAARPRNDGWEQGTRPAGRSETATAPTAPSASGAQPPAASARARASRTSAGYGAAEDGDALMADAPGTAAGDGGGINAASHTDSHQNQLASAVRLHPGVIQSTWQTTTDSKTEFDVGEPSDDPNVITTRVTTITTTTTVTTFTSPRSRGLVEFARNPQPIPLVQQPGASSDAAIQRGDGAPSAPTPSSTSAAGKLTRAVNGTRPRVSFALDEANNEGAQDLESQQDNADTEEQQMAVDEGDDKTEDEEDGGDKQSGTTRRPSRRRKDGDDHPKDNNNGPSGGSAGGGAGGHSTRGRANRASTNSTNTASGGATGVTTRRGRRTSSASESNSTKEVAKDSQALPTNDDSPSTRRRTAQGRQGPSASGVLESSPLRNGRQSLRRTASLDQDKQPSTEAKAQRTEPRGAANSEDSTDKRRRLVSSAAVSERPSRTTRAVTQPDARAHGESHASDEITPRRNQDTSKALGTEEFVSGTWKGKVFLESGIYSNEFRSGMIRKRKRKRVNLELRRLAAEKRARLAARLRRATEHKYSDDSDTDDSISSLSSLSDDDDEDDVTLLPEDMALPMPEHFGYFLLVEDRDFQLPFAIAQGADEIRARANALKKPKAYVQISSNRYALRPKLAGEVSVCQCKPPPPLSDAERKALEGAIDSSKYENAEPIRRGCGEDCINRQMQYVCDPKKCPCGAECSNLSLGKRLHPKLEVVNYGDRGFGLRAPFALKKDQYLGEYRGEVIDLVEAARRIRELYIKEGNYYLLDYDAQAGEVLDAGMKGSVIRFANHSCNPNCYVMKWSICGTDEQLTGEFQIGMYAARDIEAGEELTYDYGWSDFRSKVSAEVTAPIPCLCRAPNCVKVLGGKKNGLQAELAKTSMSSAATKKREAAIRQLKQTVDKATEPEPATRLITPAPSQSTSSPPPKDKEEGAVAAATPPEATVSASTPDVTPEVSRPPVVRVDAPVKSRSNAPRTKLGPNFEVAVPIRSRGGLPSFSPGKGSTAPTACFQLSPSHSRRDRTRL